MTPNNRQTGRGFHETESELQNFCSFQYDMCKERTADKEAIVIAEQKDCTVSKDTLKVTLSESSTTVTSNLLTTPDNSTDSGLLPSDNNSRESLADASNQHIAAPLNCEIKIENRSMSKILNEPEESGLVRTEATDVPSSSPRLAHKATAIDSVFGIAYPEQTVPGIAFTVKFKGQQAPVLCPPPILAKLQMPARPPTRRDIYNKLQGAQHRRQKHHEKVKARMQMQSTIRFNAATPSLPADVEDNCTLPHPECKHWELPKVSNEDKQKDSYESAINVSFYTNITPASSKTSLRSILSQKSRKSRTSVSPAPISNSKRPISSMTRIIKLRPKTAKSSRSQSPANSLASICNYSNDELDFFYSDLSCPKSSDHSQYDWGSDSDTNTSKTVARKASVSDDDFFL